MMTRRYEACFGILKINTDYVDTYITVNILKTELYTLNGWTTWHVNICQ